MKNKLNVTRNWCLKKKKIYYYNFFGGGGIGISPRASNWLETTMDSALPFAFSRRPYDPRNASTLQNISVCPACCVLKSCRGDIMSQSPSLSLSLSLSLSVSVSVSLSRMCPNAFSGTETWYRMI